MELLDLDEVTAEVGVEVKIKGVTYPTVEPPLADLLKSMKMIKQIENSESLDDMSAMMSSMLNTAATMVPGCPRAVIDKLSSTQVSKLLSVVNEASNASAAPEAFEGAEVEKK